jgi:hypothetical protein
VPRERGRGGAGPRTSDAGPALRVCGDCRHPGEVGQDLPPLPAACRPVMLPITSLVPSAAPHVQSPRQLPATFQQVLMVGPVLCEVTSISLVTEIVSQRDGRSSRRGTTCISPTGTFGSIRSNSGLVVSNAMCGRSRGLHRRQRLARDLMPSSDNTLPIKWTYRDPSRRISLLATGYYKPLQSFW